MEAHNRLKVVSTLHSLSLLANIVVILLLTVPLGLDANIIRWAAVVVITIDLVLEAVAYAKWNPVPGTRLSVSFIPLVVLVVLLAAGSCNNPLAPTEAPAAEPTAAPAAEPAIAPTNAPASEPTAAPPAAAALTDGLALNYDETNNDGLAPGQSALIASYLRLNAPITQQMLEGAVAKIQQEAASSKAEVHEGETLVLDDRQAWFVWCSDASKVNEPSDVSFTLDKLYADATLGRVWVQNVLRPEVPARNDNQWSGCNGKFWAVRVR